MPLTSNQFATDWSQHTTGQVPPDWYKRRTLSTNGYYDLKVETDGTSPTGRALVLSGTGGASRLFAWSAVPETTAIEVLVLVKGSSIAANAVGGAWVCNAFDSVDDSKFAEYGVRVLNGALDLWKYTFSTGYYSMASPALPGGMGDNVWMWLRLRRGGGNIQFRAWVYGGAEPGTWTSSVADDISVPAGACGIYANNVAGGARYAYFSAAVAGETAPMPGNGITALNSTIPTPTVSNATVSTDWTPFSVGTTPTGWTPGYTTTGVNWLVATDGTSPSGKVLRVTNTSTGRHYLDTPASDGEPRQEVLARVQLGSPGTYGTGVAVCFSGTSGHNFLFGNGELTSHRFNAGSFTGLLSVSAPYPTVNGAEHWIRLYLNGTALRGRAWPIGEREPTDWQYRTTETVISGGSPALYSYDATTLDYVAVYASAGAPPAAPSALDATGVAGAVDLAWTDNSSTETGFRIYRGLSPSFIAGAPLHTTAAGATAYSDTSAVVGTLYYYRVTAVNAAGESAASNEDSAIALVVPPTEEDPMPELVLGGVTVKVQAFSILPSEQGGGYWAKRNWSVKVVLESDAESATLRTAIQASVPRKYERAINGGLRNGPFINCSGDRLGATILCGIEVGEQQMEVTRWVTPVTFHHTLPLTLREV